MNHKKVRYYTRNTGTSYEVRNEETEKVFGTFNENIKAFNYCKQLNDNEKSRMAKIEKIAPDMLTAIQEFVRYEHDEEYSVYLESHIEEHTAGNVTPKEYFLMRFENLINEAIS
jgi:hypothetical protein